MRSTPRGRPEGGPFQVSRLSRQVLKHLGITEDDVWWRYLTDAVATELSQLRGNISDANRSWPKLEVSPKSQKLCTEALQTVALKVQRTDSSLPQWLRDDEQVRQILKWKFAYQHKVIRDNAITKSKHKKTLPARQPSDDAREDISSQSTESVSGFRTAEGDNSQELDLRPRIEQASNTELLALPVNTLISTNILQRSDQGLVSISTFPPGKFKSIPDFICVAAPHTAKQNIEDYPSIAIRCSVEGPPAGYKTHRMYNKANMAEMKKRYGVGQANYDASSEPPVPVIHQDLATWHLLQDFGRSVTFENWSWIHKQVHLLEIPSSRRVEQAKAFRPGDHSSVFLLHPGPLDATLRRRYAILETQVHRSPRSLAVFPALTELEHTGQKLGDLTALDELAADKHYRPKSCLIGNESRHFPHDGCSLTGGQQYVAKRNFSSCSMHVIERVNAVRQRSQQDSTPPEPALGIDRWFYQELVPFLRDVGEFRVFITTVSDPSGTRGRRGKHIHSIFTKPRATPGFAAFVLDDYFWTQYLAEYFAPLTQDHLRAFALEVYEGLRARSDWKMYYESLDVGVRLDIGVSLDKRFFVNEVTRIWCGDFFSDQTLAEPKRKIVWAVAKALHEYYQ